MPGAGLSCGYQQLPFGRVVVDLHAWRGLDYMDVSEIKLAETFKFSPALLPEIDLKITKMEDVVSLHDPSL